MSPALRLKGALALLLFASLGAATVLPRSDVYNAFPLRARQDELDTDTCLPSCDIDTCGGGSCSPGGFVRRSAGLEGLIESFEQLNVSSESQSSPLAKRLFRYSTNVNTYQGGRDPTVGEVDGYIPAVFNGGEDAHFGGALALVSDGDERAFSQQRQFGSGSFQIVSGGLHGCTVVTLVSNRAVWMAHFWESYSHGKPNLDSPANEPAFVERVINHLTGTPVPNPSPSTYKPYIAPTGPSIDASLFNAGADDQTTLFILSPVRDGQQAGSTQYKYAQRLTAIETAVRRHLGQRIRMVRYGYQRLNYDDPGDRALVNQSGRGMCLFQFDADSDGNGQKAWRLFLEHSFTQRKI